LEGLTGLPVLLAQLALVPHSPVEVSVHESVGLAFQ